MADELIYIPNDDKQDPSPTVDYNYWLKSLTTTSFELTNEIQ